MSSKPKLLYTISCASNEQLYDKVFAYHRKAGHRSFSFTVRYLLKVGLTAAKNLERRRYNGNYGNKLEHDGTDNRCLFEIDGFHEG